MAVRGYQAQEHVEPASVGHPGRNVSRCKHVAVKLYGHEASLIVAHATNAEASVQFPQCARQAVEVGPLSAYHAVGILGQAFSAIGPSGGSPDEQVLDAVAVEDFDKPG